jgi:hypothetical protein
MWTRVSSDENTQLALEGRDQCGHQYPPTRAPSWLRSVVTNVTRISYDMSSQLASEGSDQRGNEYPTTRAASWLWRAVTNVDTSFLRHEQSLGFVVPWPIRKRISYDTSSQLASECRYKCGHEYPTTRGASCLRSAVTNVDTSILRHEQSVGFGGL